MTKFTAKRKLQVELPGMTGPDLDIRNMTAAAHLPVVMQAARIMFGPALAGRALRLYGGASRIDQVPAAKRATLFQAFAALCFTGWNVRPKARPKMPSIRVPSQLHADIEILKRAERHRAEMDRACRAYDALQAFTIPAAASGPNIEDSDSTYENAMAAARAKRDSEHEAATRLLDQASAACDRTGADREKAERERAEGGAAADAKAEAAYAAESKACEAYDLTYKRYIQSTRDAGANFKEAVETARAALKAARQVEAHNRTQDEARRRLLARATVGGWDDPHPDGVRALYFLTTGQNLK